MNKSTLILTPSPDALACEGEIDLSTSDSFRAALLAQPPLGRVLTVDLCRVWFVDSAGLAAVIAAYKRGQKEGFSVRLLVQAGRQPDRVLRLSGMPQIMEIEYPEPKINSDKETA